MLRPFELHQPESVASASRALGAYGDEAAFYAGGTELLLVMKEGLVRYRHLLDLKTIPDLAGIHEADGWLHIGGVTTHRTLEHHPLIHARVPVLAEVERRLANVRIRSVGTLGGNLCFAEPHADPGTLLLTLDAEVDLASHTGTRTVPLGEFFTGAYETARAPDEILTRVRVRPPGPQTRGAYLKFGIHERPTLGVAAALTLDPEQRTVLDVRLAVGCVGPVPTRLPEAEGLLRGLPLADLEGRLDAAAASARLAAVDDLHGSAEYKQAMVTVFIRRAVRAARARFPGPGEEPPA